MALKKLQRANKHGKAGYDLVLTDVFMPKVRHLPTQTFAIVLELLARLLHVVPMPVSTRWPRYRWMGKPWCAQSRPTSETRFPLPVRESTLVAGCAPSTSKC